MLWNLSWIIRAWSRFVLVLKGMFYMIQPNQGVAITLFGDYRGTDRTTGLRWIWPWMGGKKISVRANNLISERIKVNDLRGNPIEMAAQVVWRVIDTAQALFDVDDYQAFVTVQIEAAVRTIGSRYPYDDFEHARKSRCAATTTRSASELRAELIARLTVAGHHGRRMRLHPSRLCAGDRRGDAAAPAGARRWSPRARRWSKARSAWSRWRSQHALARRTSSSSTTSGARRWSRT